MSNSPQHRIRAFYGFDFPDDFFEFHDFIRSLPDGLLLDVCDMSPAYPFALAEGKPPTDYPDHPFWEDRYYHDLPEFVTLLNGHTDGLHYGYFFDAPGALPPIVAHYWHSDTFQHANDGDTLFQAVRWHVEKAECDFQDLMESREDEEDYCCRRLEQAGTLRGLLRDRLDDGREETGTEYLDTYHGSAWRRPVADTWDDLGIVVRRSEYQPLTRNPITKPRADISAELIARAAQEAMDLLSVGFPGTALKFGRDLWVWAKDFPVCYELLDAAYAALGREPLRRLLAEARAWRARCDELAATRGK